jgi:hypothetical protein
MGYILDLTSMISDRAKRQAPSGWDAVYDVDQSQLSEEFIDFNYDFSHVQTTTLAPTEIDRVEYDNGTDVQQSQTLGQTHTTTASTETTVTQGVSTSTSGGFSINFPGLGANLNIQQTLSLSTQQAQGNSVTQTWNCSTPIDIPAHSTVDVSWSISEVSYEAPFSGVLQIHGTVRLNGHWAGGFKGWEFYGVGELFSKYPDPSIRVLDEQTISVNVTGVTVCSQGINLITKVDQHKDDKVTNVDIRSRFRTRFA